MKQQLAAASLHRWRAVPCCLAQSFYYSCSHTWVTGSQVGQCLKSACLNNGTAVLNVTAQQRVNELQFFGVQPESWNHNSQVPAQFLLLGFGHQTQQSLLVWSQQVRILPGNLFGRVRCPHSHQRIFGPATLYQLWEQCLVLGNGSRHLIGAANGSPVSALKKTKDVRSRHRAR